jgi:hypothetical protein
VDERVYTRGRRAGNATVVSRRAVVGGLSASALAVATHSGAAEAGTRFENDKPRAFIVRPALVRDNRGRPVVPRRYFAEIELLDQRHLCQQYEIKDRDDPKKWRVCTPEQNHSVPAAFRLAFELQDVAGAAFVQAQATFDNDSFKSKSVSAIAFFAEDAKVSLEFTIRTETQMDAILARLFEKRISVDQGGGILKLFRNGHWEVETNPASLSRNRLFALESAVYFRRLEIHRTARGQARRCSRKSPARIRAGPGPARQRPTLP